MQMLRAKHPRKYLSNHSPDSRLATNLNLLLRSYGVDFILLFGSHFDHRGGQSGAQNLPSIQPRSISRIPSLSMLQHSRPRSFLCWPRRKRPKTNLPQMSLRCMAHFSRCSLSNFHIPNSYFVRIKVEDGH